MARKYRPVHSYSTQLVQKLHNAPGLSSLIPKIHTARLRKLVTQIGKEDAQDILIHATAEQISDLVEGDVWQSSKPGDRETYSPETFLEWIYLWGEAGTPYLSKRLKELGSNMLSLTLDSYITVVDIQEVGISGSAHVFSQYAVLPKEDEHWPDIISCLAELGDEDPAFLEEALAHCCMRRSLTAEKTHIAHNENLAPDVESERDRHRRNRGYVTRDSAVGFLAEVAGSTLDELILKVDYDPLTAMQLRLQFQIGSDPDNDAPEGDRRESDEEAAEVEPGSVGQSSAGSVKPDLDALIDSIIEEQSSNDSLLLTGPSEKSQLYLDARLTELRNRNPESAARRANEIIYLANILVEGLPLAGARLSERQALQGVSSLANLGLLHCVQSDPWDTEAALLTELLENPPGMVKVFSIGYRLLVSLTDMVHVGLAEAMAVEKCDAGFRFEDLNSVLDGLLITIDAQVSENLRSLGDRLPRFPTVLDGKGGKAIYVNKEWRFFSTPADVDTAIQFLEDLKLEF